MLSNGRPFTQWPSTTTRTSQAGRGPLQGPQTLGCSLTGRGWHHSFRNQPFLVGSWQHRLPGLGRHIPDSCCYSSKGTHTLGGRLANTSRKPGFILRILWAYSEADQSVIHPDIPTPGYWKHFVSRNVCHFCTTDCGWCSGTVCHLKKKKKHLHCECPCMYRNLKYELRKGQIMSNINA